MALRRTLAYRLFSTSQLRVASGGGGAAAPCPCGRARRLPAVEPPLLLRLLQRRPLFQFAVPPDRSGDKLIDRIRATVADRIRLDGILPPAPPEAAPAGMTVDEVRKVIRATQVEAARARLRDAGKSCVAYEEFVQMCCDASSEKQGPGIARTLDEAGAVIVLGDHVLLRPDQVAKTVRSMILLPTTTSPSSDQQSSELREMKEKKALIDKKEADILGAVLGCDGAHLLLRHLCVLHGRLRLLHEDCEGTLLWRLLRGPLCCEAEAPHEGAQF